LFGRDADVQKVLVDEQARLRVNQTDAPGEETDEAEHPLLVHWRVTAEADELPAWLTEEVEAQLADQVARAVRRTLGKARQGASA
jgi:hypothetical protein